MEGEVADVEAEGVASKLKKENRCEEHRFFDGIVGWIEEMGVGNPSFARRGRGGFGEGLLILEPSFFVELKFEKTSLP